MLSWVGLGRVLGMQSDGAGVGWDGKVRHGGTYANAKICREVAASELVATTMVRKRTTVVNAIVAFCPWKASPKTTTNGIGLTRALGMDVMLKQYTVAISSVNGALM